MLRRVLVANRGEIAVRVMRTCRELGISPVAIYSEADRGALHVRCADRAICVGPPEAAKSYLDVARIIEAARRTGADAIHPGYGFLSENPELARACVDAGLVFIGPEAEHIRQMGDKRQARATMERAGVPLIPGAHGSARGLADGDEALMAARQIGFPVMLKAAAGGGGKGIRLVTAEQQLPAAFEAARREALAAFGDGALYLEKYLEHPRHVEVQILADGRGHAVHLFERDCSLQRRHQKLAEETPCPALDEETRRAMGEVAVRAVKALRYRGAGTLEFLYLGPGCFYFLEMNTRIQVEHPITELCTGEDLVRHQILIAAGEPLALEQEQLCSRGAAIECRITAEDPVTLLPSPGRIERLTVPAGPGVRDDSGVAPGAEVPVHYESLLSKLCVWAPDRPQAVARMQRALGEYQLTGIQTNLDLHRRLMAHPAFAAGTYDTAFVEAHQAELAPAETEADTLSLAAAVIDAHLRASEQRAVRAAPDKVQVSPWRLAARWRQR